MNVINYTHMDQNLKQHVEVLNDLQEVSQSKLRIYSIRIISSKIVIVNELAYIRNHFVVHVIMRQVSLLILMVGKDMNKNKTANTHTDTHTNKPTHIHGHNTILIIRQNVIKIT